MSMKPTLLILAAGIGRRYGGLKQMDQVGPSGETIIDYSIYDAIRSGYGKVVFVIRKEIEKEFSEIFISKVSRKIEVDYVFQEIDMVLEGVDIVVDRVKPWGTAHAILVAEKKINEPFAVINADDFYGRLSFNIMADFLVNSSMENEYAMVGYKLNKTLSEYGQVARGVCITERGAYLNQITERTNIEKISTGIVFRDDNNKIVTLTGDETVSMNFWGFKPSVFSFLNKYFTDFINEFGGDLKKEFFIPILITDLIEKNLASVKVLQSGEKWFGVTYKKDKKSVVRKISEKVNKGEYPNKLWE